MSKSHFCVANIHRISQTAKFFNSFLSYGLKTHSKKRQRTSRTLVTFQAALHCHQGGTSSASKRHFVSIKVVLHFSFFTFLLTIPLILHARIIRRTDVQRVLRHEGDMVNPPHYPNISPSFFGAVPIMLKGGGRPYLFTSFLPFMMTRPL